MVFVPTYILYFHWNFNLLSPDFEAASDIHLVITHPTIAYMSPLSLKWDNSPFSIPLWWEDHVDCKDTNIDHRGKRKPNVEMWSHQVMIQLTVKKISLRKDEVHCKSTRARLKAMLILKRCWCHQFKRLWAVGVPHPFVQYISTRLFEDAFILVVKPREEKASDKAMLCKKIVQWELTYM